VNSLPTDASSYFVYGLRLVSAYPFTYPLVKLEREAVSGESDGVGAGNSDVDDFDAAKEHWPTVRFELTDEGDRGTDYPERPSSLPAPVFDDRVETPLGASGCAVYVLPEFTLMRFNDAADFYVRPGRIACHLYDERYHFAIEIWLLGTVLAYLLELDGTQVLHASVVEVDGLGVGFLASNKGGKSSLAAAFVQAGGRLLSDDLLALRFTDAGVMALPGYPQMRMWPEQAERLIGSTSGLPRVQPSQAKLRVPLTRVGSGGFCAEPRRLAALYLPERDDGGMRPVAFERLGAAEAMTELTRHSFLAPLLGSGEWVPRRFSAFGRVLAKVPVKRLRYPSGVERLRGVVEGVAEDVAGLKGAPPWL